MRTKALCLAGAMLCCATLALAYDENATHPALTGAAVRASDLGGTKSVVLANLGLSGDVHRARWLTIDPILGFSAASILSVMAVGSSQEDHDIATQSVLSASRYRVFRHFFDPQHDDRGLTVGDKVLGEPSPEWALEDVVEIGLQEFSYKDAKGDLRSALVGASEAERERSLRRMFLTIGHVVHHLQDMAQPQHVRNEDHCQSVACELFGRHFPSAYERFTADRARDIPTAGYGPADYGTFSVPRLFWDHQGMGLAELTSQNFVGTRSNFRGSAEGIFPAEGFPLPNGGGVITEKRQITDPDLLGPVGPGQPLSGEIWFLHRAVPDQYRSAQSGVNRRLSSYSVFNSDLTDLNETSVPAFTLTRFNHAAANDFLLPRAAAYSTGLINYFFRGRIEITLPAEGVYGVLDHATTYAAGQGFGKLKLRLRNASPDGVKPSGERVPQAMQGGTLVAVAKYTLNGCYQPDLSGDYGARYDTGEIFEPANCSFAQYLAGEEQIAQSTAILAASLDPVTPTEFTFDFSSQPIPVNARDLRVQVVYTGTLGAEQDAIAFGGKDISEPTHLSIYNSSDYFAVDGKLYTPAQIKADPALSQRVAGLNIDPRALTGLAMAIVPGKPIVGSSGLVPVNGYVRVAVLADADKPMSLSVLSRFEGTGFSEATFPAVWPTVIDLRSPEGYITPYGIFRGPRASFFDVLFKANSSAPLASGELLTLSGRLVADPGPTPIPVRF
jgi:hypothetical protein